MRAAIVAFACLWAAGAAAQVRVDMRVDRTSITLDDTIVVRVEVESQGGGSPEIELPSFAGFEVVGRRIERPMQFSFNFGSGAVFRSSTNYTFQLKPLQLGTLRIDPVKVTVDGQRHASGAIEVAVGPGSGSASPPVGPPVPAAPDAPDPKAIDETAFLRLVADDPEPYVGEQVTVTAILYTRNMLRSAPQVDQEPATAGFWTLDLLSPTHTLRGQRQIVQGRAYSAYVLRRFAAFPLREGALSLGPMTIRIDERSVFDLLGGGSGAALERTAPPVVLNVKSLPPDGRPPGDVAVGRFELGAALDRSEVVTGDAVTLTAIVRGEGNLQTVRMATPVLDGVDVLAPEIKDLPDTQGDRVRGVRQIAWLLIPKVPGEHALSPLVLQTFDPATGQYRRLEGPALMLRAAGNPVAPVAASPDEPPADAARAPDAPTAAVEWPTLRDESVLERRSTRLVASPAYHAALAAPPLLWIGLVLGAAWRRRIASRAATPRERAMREARAHLASAREAARRSDAAAFHAEAAGAVTAALSARTGVEVTGLTRPELRALVAGRADADLAAAVAARLDRADAARFGIGDGGALGDEAAALDALFARIETIHEPGGVT